MRHFPAWLGNRLYPPKLPKRGTPIVIAQVEDVSFPEEGKDRNLDRKLKGIKEKLLNVEV